MSCYDTVEIRCSDCAGTVEFQSKGGDCILARYLGSHVPTDVAAGCDEGICDTCSRTWQARLPSHVRVELNHEV